MIDRAFQPSNGTEGEDRLQQFADYDDIAHYSKQALAYLVNEKIMNGYNGKLQPKAPITRAETAQLLFAMVADMIDSSRLYSDCVVEGNVVIRSADVALKNVVIRGNLLLTEGIGDGKVTLDAVTVTGNIIIAGGGSIQFENSQTNIVIINKKGEPTQILFSDKSGAAHIIVRQKAHFALSANSSLGTLIINHKRMEQQLKLRARLTN